MLVLGRCRRGFKGIVTLACLFLVFLPFALARDSDDEALRHFAAAQRAQNAGQLDEAASEYLKVVQLLPNAAEAYASLGLVYNAQGKYADSAQALAKAEKLKPGLPGVSLYLGIDDLRMHQPASAVLHLRAAIRSEPKNEQAHTWLSEALSDSGQHDAALAELQKASLLFPSDPALLLDLSRLCRRAADQKIDRIFMTAKGSPLQHQIYGDIYKDQHAWSNAKAHYYRALELDTQWHGAHFGLGEIALQNQELDLASHEYHLELQTNPRSGAAMARLAEIALLENKPGDALTQFESAIKAAPEEAAHAVGLPPDPVAGKSDELAKDAQSSLRSALSQLEAAPPAPARSLAIAVVDLRLGQTDASLAAWKQFQQSAPHSNPSTTYQRALIQFDQQNLNAADVSVRSWLSTHPVDLQAVYLSAKIDQALSFSALQKLLELAPDSYPAHQALGDIYEESQNDNKALSEYKLAESMAPNLPGIHFSIGNLFVKLHREDDALTELQTALGMDQDNPEANAEVGAIYLNRLDPAKAIPYLEHAVQQENDLWSAHQQLGKAYYTQKEYTRATAELLLAVQHDPDGAARYQLGLVYRALGKNKEAGEQFEISRKIKLENLSHAKTEMTTFQKQLQ
ncbi:tetratricopeptide repeat protein [Paracidobacterium acidisoli]|uniref:Tetratricopeptide repeat protein n=1 Tax=Paracidobacterium acidisoli TaxID=2303751 RepID=A0A372ILZ1_9BACT|nr:tetratricopeptide repeat protein [Paracidobacterium acidisoli]MBT9332372.1 tetratricopeptide repeat protein [Paracidobacterium acidisoli]